MKSAYLYIISAFILAVASACRSDIPDYDFPEMSETVRFGVNVAKVGNTRAIPEAGEIREGTLNVLFRNSDKNHELGSVVFTNGIGAGRRIVDDATVELKWSDVASESDDAKKFIYSFYLDNLPASYGNNEIINFPEDDGEDDHPYRISSYDHESNDLLWGALENVNRANTLSVDLNHIMSRFCLRLFFDNTAGFDTQVPVSANLTNIFHKAVSLDRTTGNLELSKRATPEGNGMPIPDPYFLVKTTEEWGKPQEDEETGMTYYSTPDFVIPPQEFVPNSRPRLTVVLSKGGQEETYTGLLPQAMDLVGDHGELIPWIMSFLKGYRIILNVTVSNQANSLIFMPATVLDWNDKGKKTLTGNQASVAKEEEIEDLIRAYKSGSIGEFYKWGYELDTNPPKWIFNIFQNFEVNVNKLRGQMKESDEPPYDFPPYDFNLHFATVTIILEDNTKVELNSDNNGAARLKSLLSKGVLPDYQEPDPGE